MKKYIAEFIGTFVLVMFGCGSAVAANSIFLSMGSPLPIAFTTLLIAFAFGLSIVAMVYSIGNISGCHINPAVSLSMLITKKMNVKDFIGYVIAQFVGASVGAMFLWFCFGAKDSLGQNGYGSASTLGINMGVAAVLEIVLTCVFVLVILCVTSKKEYNPVAGLVIGLTLTLIHIFGIPFTGTSVNPARSFGPAVFVGGDALKQLPVFIIAPLVGAALAAVLYLLLFNEEKDEEVLETEETESVLAEAIPESEKEESDEEEAIESKDGKSEDVEDNLEEEEENTEIENLDTSSGEENKENQDENVNENTEIKNSVDENMGKTSEESE